MTPLTNHTTSLALSQRLREAGVPQESYFHWILWSTGDWVLGDKETVDGLKKDIGEKHIKTVSAFLASELGELFPTALVIVSWNNLQEEEDRTVWCCESLAYPRVDKIFPQNGATEANARALMLLHLLSHNLISFKTGV